MNNPVHEQLLGHLLGVLEDAEERQVVERLVDEPQLRDELHSVREQLKPLQAAARCEFEPPAGLAARTCRFVAERAAAESRPLPDTVIPASEIPASDIAVPGDGGIRWVDVVMAASIFLAAGLLIIPALQNSRFNARLAACQNNLRQLGLALTQYSESQNGYFPAVPTKGRLAAAGIYAPMLRSTGLLPETSNVVCPASPLAERRETLKVPSVDELLAASAPAVPEMQQTMGGSYGYNLGYVNDGHYQSPRNLRRSNFALMADAPSTELPGYQSMNHSGRGQNVLFEDGRVRFLATPKPEVVNDDLFTNDNGLVAAGTHSNDSVIGSSTTPPIFYVNNPN